jgi:predicted SAM-dependent methyltransferase/ADP-heptose:LPS heptosyltransferase
VVWKPEAKQGNEAGKVIWEMVRWTRGKGIDVGCGAYKPYQHFIGCDSGRDIQLYGHSFKPDVWIDDAAELKVFASESLDFVFSSHLLEHIEPDRVVKTLKEWLRVLKVGGYLVMYLPDENQYPKIGEEGANKDHKWNVSRAALVGYMEKAGFWDLVDYQVRDKELEYSLWFVFQKKAKGHKFSIDEYERPRKTCGVVRYGAFGDLLQASSVFAGLKKQGYHVTLYCSNPAADLVAHDPNIDEKYFQDTNQVPNELLANFWDYHRRKYDKWVNLSESVEGSFLTIPGRPVNSFPPALRHKMTNFNYLESQHMIAGVPHVPAMHFYPTPDEVEWARQKKQQMGGFTIAWAQTGSSVHKKWPWVDNVIASLLLDYEDVNFVLLGGPDCVILEQGWFKVKEGEPLRDDRGHRIMVEPRVQCTAGDWTIRQTMSFCQQADMVVGPETGVLNAVAQLKMPKVVFLSHSTDENLTRDWENTHAIYSNVTHCPGRGDNEAPACHKLHYSWQYCKNAISPDDGKEMGIAQCMADIPLEHVLKVIWHAIRAAKDERIAA